MLKIQEFINCFKDINEACIYLKKNFGIDSTTYDLSSSERLYLFRPSYTADMTNPLVREAHCLILYQDGELLSKAWNFPEVATCARDFPEDFRLSDGVNVEEMPEGKIIVIYNVEGSWIVSTDNSIIGKEVTEKHGGLALTFTYEEKITSLLSYKWTDDATATHWAKGFEKIHPNLCFVLNYVSSYNETIKPINNSSLYLTGIIDSETGKEIKSEQVDVMAKNMGFRRHVYGTGNTVYDSAALTKCLGSMNALAPGVLLRQGNRRVMIVNPIYTTVSEAVRAGKKVHPTHLAKIVQVCRTEHDIEEISRAYPDLKSMLQLLWGVKESLWKELLWLWNTAKAQHSMKGFTEIVKHHPLNYLLFMFKDQKITSFKAEIESLEPTKLVSITRDKWEKQFVLAQDLLKFSEGEVDGNTKEAEWEFQDGD